MIVKTKKRRRKVPVVGRVEARIVLSQVTKAINNHLKVKTNAVDNRKGS
jgi:hypothetical protein